ncbi:hypothetical protein B0H67DRAFT_486112 [Lasiosphaeris hirsuta]|uniref:DUF1996 domain-containing protein n=1 Tax=Lasiosphaeris hirsuta TaxID=260670 RepID=A0AA40AQ62_9PEZI|nr:hypothetical protein B0H67DRAFT_486112 [Lasiosphaeris hirsuta]
MKATTSLALLGAVSGVSAFWRMECRGRVGVARIDPLVNPNEVAQHVHAIHGSSGFSESAKFDDLAGADCTSCAVTEDMSSYWAPVPYFKHANGSYELVEQVGGMLAYYFLFGDASNPNGGIKAFPEDFRMIAGDTLRRNFSIGGLGANIPDPEKSLWSMLGQTSQVDLAQRALGFNCLNYQKAPEGSLHRHYMPEKDYLDANCEDGVRIEIMFPSCWNGKDLDSKNHRSHVAYPDLVMNGDCPSGFDVKIPGLFYETIWATNAFAGREGEFVFSNGDIQGFGYHADFISGWKSDFLQEAVDTCTNPSGRIQDCPIFTIQDEDTQRKCGLKKMPSVLVNEKVVGSVGTSLPGGVQIQYGPEPATNPNPGPQTATVAVPTVGYSEGVKPTDTNYLPGQIFKETTSSAPESASVTSASAEESEAAITAQAVPSITAAPAAPAAVEDGYEIIRTDYITEGHVVKAVIVKEKVEYITVTTTTATLTSTAQPLKARHDRHVHRHQLRHARP